MYRHQDKRGTPLRTLLDRIGNPAHLQSVLFGDDPSKHERDCRGGRPVCPLSARLSVCRKEGSTPTNVRRFMAITLAKTRKKKG